MEMGEFQNKSRDSASWDDPDFAFNLNTPAGSQGNVGIHPRDVVNKDRNALGAYIDFETEIKNKLLMNLAGRYEFYSDFGDNLAGKLALRYKLHDNFSIRGSVGNGFRAPSLQQRFLKSINNGVIRGPADCRLSLCVEFFHSIMRLQKPLISPLLQQKTL
jgi:outer membrane cobalamin receptor